MSTAATLTRTDCAAQLMACKPEDVQMRVRGMSPAQRVMLTRRIDGVMQFLKHYEKAERELGLDGTPPHEH